MSKKHIYAVGDRVKYLSPGGWEYPNRRGTTGVITTVFDRTSRKATEFLGRIKWDVNPTDKWDDYVYEDEVEFVDVANTVVPSSAVGVESNGAERGEGNVDSVNASSRTRKRPAV